MTQRTSKTLSVLLTVLTMAVIYAPRTAYAQNQLVLLKKEKVFLRLSYGDEIIYRTKGSHKKVVSYVNNLFDTAVQAHKTIVPFYKIERLYFTRSNFINVIGGGLVVGGVGYFLLDQANEIIVHGHDATLNKRVTTTSAAMLIVGLPMMLIKKKSTRIGRKFRLMTVGPDSHFYQRELQHDAL